MAEQREMFECIVHGWVQSVDGPELVWSGEHQKFVEGFACPVSMGYEGECGFELKGPFLVEKSAESPRGQG